MKKVRIVAGLLACSVLGIVSMSFQPGEKRPSSLITQVRADTPKKNSIHLELDLKGLDKALNELNIELKGIDWDKISNDIKISLDSIDVTEIKADVVQSLNNVDWQKIKADVQSSLKDINIEDIRLDIQKTTDNIKENLNSEQMHKNLKKLKIEAEELKKDMKKAQQQLDQHKDELKNNLKKLKKDTGTATTTKVETNETFKGKEVPFRGKNRLFVMI